ncbi:MAG: hypothetical protein WBF43_12735 [Methylocella sp.]
MAWLRLTARRRAVRAKRRMEAGLRIFSRPRLARLSKAIGQCAAGRKSHAIEAIPDLLETPAINGAIVSIDAIGTRKAIAAKIVAQDAGCVLALKGNRSAPRRCEKVL